MGNHQWKLPTCDKQIGFRETNENRRKLIEENKMMMIISHIIYLSILDLIRLMMMMINEMEDEAFK
jgi:hypothetical protein